MANAAPRIAAKGVPITLIDGTKHNLRYGFMGIAELEEKYESLDGVSEAIDQAFDSTGNLKKKSFAFVWNVVRIGLMQEHIEDEDLDRLMDPSRFAEYFTAFSLAFAQALAGGKSKGGAPSKKKSLGPTSTTSPQSATGEATPSSGG